MADSDTSNPPVKGVIPYIYVEGASEAAAFYERAFGARELRRIMADDGKRVMHCHLVINDGNFMMSDIFAEYGHSFQPSRSFTMHLQVDDAQEWWDRAVAAGAEVAMPLQKMFWGDMYGHLRDPFGVTWAIGAPTKE